MKSEGFAGAKRQKMAACVRVLIVLVFCFASWLAYWPATAEPVLAVNTRERFENDIQKAKERINQLNIQLDGVRHEQATLQEAVAALDSEIGVLQQLINDTEADIVRLQLRIAALQEEIEAQIVILEHLLVLLYKRSDISTFELLITADSFSDYFNDQEYLDRLRSGVGNSVRHIQSLQAELGAEEAAQARLLDDQKAQEILLQASRWEKNELLRVTQNQEALYQAWLSEAQAEQQELERALQAYLDSLISVKRSLGRVNAGDIVGKNGNTGWSTGPHLHIAIYAHNGIRYDPLNFLYERNLIWPMGGNGGWVSQGFHSAHQAMDIAAEEGTFIRAIAAGDIIHRGCLFADINIQYSTFGVIIDHGDYLSLYIHMQAPDNPKYSVCSINRGNQYGTLSVDYDTKE